MIKDSYFQFPLCSLSFGREERPRVDAIIDYSLVEAGQRMLEKLTLEQRRKCLATRRRAGRSPFGFDESNWYHVAALQAAEVIKVSCGDMHSLVKRHQILRDHVTEFEELHGRDALVRIKSSWLFKCRDSQGITFREFSVLCAIYSAIGNKKLAIITRNRIRHRAMGYRTEAIMLAELPRRADAAKPLTERELRDTIARLHRNRFFARCTVGRRITYYSIRLDNEELRKSVSERRTYASFFHSSQAAQDQALTLAIKRKRVESCQMKPNVPPPALLT